MNMSDFLLASGFMGAIFAFVQQLIVWQIKRRSSKKDDRENELLKRLKIVKGDVKMQILGD